MSKGASSDSPAEPWFDRAQVVSVSRSRFEPAMVEIAAVLRDPEGVFIHRRVRYAGDDLRAAAFVLEPDAGVAATGGDPPQPRSVQDQRYETPDGAFWAATAQAPCADPDGWLSRIALFGFLAELDVEGELKPQAGDLGGLQRLLVLGGTWTALLGGTLGALELIAPVWSEPGGALYSANEFILGALILLISGGACVLSYVVSDWLERTLERRNVAKAFDDPQAR